MLSYYTATELCVILHYLLQEVFELANHYFFAWAGWYSTLNNYFGIGDYCLSYSLTSSLFSSQSSSLFFGLEALILTKQLLLAVSSTSKKQKGLQQKRLKVYIIQNMILFLHKFQEVLIQLLNRFLLLSVN